PHGGVAAGRRDGGLQPGRRWQDADVRGGGRGLPRSGDRERLEPPRACGQGSAHRPAAPGDPPRGRLLVRLGGVPPVHLYPRWAVPPGEERVRLLAEPEPVGTSGEGTRPESRNSAGPRRSASRISG